MTKEQEAKDCIAEAEKCMKTGMLKWKPDTDGAAANYNRAATIYKTLKKLEPCIQCHKMAGLYFQQSKSYYDAAKAYEACALIYSKELKQFNEAAEMFQKACMMYREHGTPDTACMCLDRGAKAIEAHIPAKAAEFYEVAADIATIEGKVHQASEFFQKSARMYLKLKDKDKAANCLHKQMNQLIEADDSRGAGRACLCVVLVHLGRDDFVAARKVYHEGKQHVEDQERYTIELLLSGWDDGDAKNVLDALSHPFVKALDNEICKLVRDISIKFQGKVVNEFGETVAAPVGDEDDASALL